MILFFKQNLVKDFYFQTNIVYTSPGLKDEMTVWKGGKELKSRRYYVELTVDEVFFLFKVGRSKFFELKPPNVLHMSKVPYSKVNVNVLLMKASVYC